MNKTEHLIEMYQKQVDEIPSERPMVVLRCETVLEILKNLELNHKIEDDMNVLIHESLKASRGNFALPDVVSVIMLWKNSKI